LFRRTVRADSALYARTYLEVVWVSGAFLLTRAGLWHQLGGLDERYFMYMEDTDYCRRVCMAGYAVAYSSSCEVTHFEGAGRAWIGERAVLNSTHSYLVYAKKYHGTSGGFSLRVLLAPVFLGRALVHGLLGMVKMDVNGLNKAKAFGRATLILIGLSK
jgi:GT2 family glycosyltransferase